MLAQLPSNMLITRVSPSVYLPIAAFLWSGISAATFACTNAPGLWGLQFILGIVEAPLFPGMVSSALNMNNLTYSSQVRSSSCHVGILVASSHCV